MPFVHRSSLTILRAVTIVLAVALGSTAFAQSAAKPIRIVAFGDSLTAGYNLPPDASFPAQLEKALRAAGENVTIDNAGVSGDTASGGLERLDWTLSDGVDAVILELGANDMLRGIDPAITADALDKIMQALKQRKVKVLIAGMLAAPGMGQAYAEKFNGIYPALAKKYDSLLYGFFVDGVAGDTTLLLGDGMHPNRAGVAKVVANILPSIRELIAQARTN